jgi:hypothetical protein
MMNFNPTYGTRQCQRQHQRRWKAGDNGDKFDATIVQPYLLSQQKFCTVDSRN